MHNARQTSLRKRTKLVAICKSLVSTSHEISKSSECSRASAQLHKPCLAKHRNSCAVRPGQMILQIALVAIELKETAVLLQRSTEWLYEDLNPVRHGPTWTCGVWANQRVCCFFAPGPCGQWMLSAGAPPRDVATCQEVSDRQKPWPSLAICKVSMWTVKQGGISTIFLLSILSSGFTTSKFDPKLVDLDRFQEKIESKFLPGFLGEVNFYLVGPYMALQLNATRLLRMEHQSWPQTCQDLEGPHLTCRTTSCMKVGMLWCVAWKSKTFTTQGLPSYLAAGMVKSLRTIHHT